MEALAPLIDAIVPLLVEAAEVVIPAAAFALAAWLRARALRQAAEDGAVHGVLRSGDPREQEALAAEHLRRATVWGRTTTADGRRQLVRKHGPAAVRMSEAPSEPPAEP